LREKLRAGAPVGAWIPAESLAKLERGEGLVDERFVEMAILSRLRMLSDTAFADAPDVSEGLENRVYRAARTEPTLDAVVAAAGSKRHPSARIRRICMAAALGLKASDSDGIPPYLRVLAANSRGKTLLRAMEKNAALPLLTKPAHVHGLDERAGRVFALGAAAADLRALGLPAAEHRRGDRDWRAGPSIV
jgi:predicted nucleotidyltransferase